MQSFQSLIWFIIIAVLVGLAIFLYFKFIKRLKISNVYFISGAVKTGKTYVSVALAVKKYKHVLRLYYIKRFLCWLLYWISFKKINLIYDLDESGNYKYVSYINDDGLEVIDYSKKVEKIEKPMLYSNIKLRYIKHNPFTKDILLRKVRIPHKSVVLLDETSLIADSMLFKDKHINDTLLLFYKLFGHYSHGGYCIANSQQVCDNHMSLKRAMGRYLYIYNRFKFPFITHIKAVELINSEDQTNVMSFLGGDLEDNTKSLIFLNSYYKYYDCYCYSIFTDDLTLQVDYDYPILTRHDSLKTRQIVTLQSFEGLVNKDKVYEKEDNIQKVSLISVEEEREITE